MKCGFCGKELTEGAEFCPECGMILSLGGVIDEADVKENEVNEVEVPEFTPNVFRAMDFEQEQEVPAMELEVTDEEETAEVVEIIPEYVQPVEEPSETVTQEAAEEAAAETAQAVEEAQEPEAQEEFLAPEYDPNAVVSEEFLQQVANEEPVEEAEETAEEEAEESEPEEALQEVETVAAPVYEIAAEDEIEYAPDEYEGQLASEQAAPANEPEEAAYPVYVEAQEEAVPEEKLSEDESLFAALFESDDAERLEDITPETKPVEKSSKKSYLSVAVLLVVLVGIVFAGAYVFRNVLPKIVDTSNTTAATDEKVDGTTEKTTAEKTTAEKTTEKTTAEKTTEEKTTEEKTTTEKTTEEKETTTKSTTEKPTEQAADSGEAVVVEPSSYNVDEVPFFPAEGDISIKAGPSSTSADMITHPWGYPVYAYAKEGNYYYVHSPYLDYMGWVYANDVEEYVEGTEAESAEPEENVTDAPSGEDDGSYLAIINSAEGLNFRSGPGAEYGAEIVVPGGFYVRVTDYSAENPGWVYVVVEDDRYPYGTPGGWVLEEYLA